MRISYTSNRFLIFIIFTACLCLFFAIQKKKPTPLDNSSEFEIPTNKYSSILGLNLDKLPNEDEVLKLFQVWKKEHERVYKDLEEMANKFKTFVTNLKYIVETNAKRESPDSSLLGLTDFADMSFMEFKETYLDCDTMDNVDDHDDDVNELTCSKPSSNLDWRKKGVVTSVKNQRACGSCWAFAAIGAIEGIVAIKTKKTPAVDLSAQEVLDCDSGSCRGGSSIKAFEWVIGNKGVALEKNYPYKAVKGDCKSKQIPNSPTSAIHSFNRVPKTDEGLLCALINQPIKVGFIVTEDFQHHYTGKIYEGPKCPVDSTTTDHAMLIVGYGTEKGKDYWIVKNTWGKRWGKNGYALVRRNTGKKYGVCGINANAAFPIKNN